MKWLCSLTMLVLLACGGAVEVSERSTGPLISMHLASEEQQPGFALVEVEGRELFMSTEPLVSDQDITAVQPARGQDAVILDIHVTPDAAARLQDATAENVGQPLVVMFDSEIADVPIIRSEIRGSRAQLAVPAISAEKVDEMIERVRARWPPE